MNDVHAEFREGAVDQRELIGRGILHRDAAAGDRAERQKGRDLVEILGQAKLAAGELVDAVDA